MKEYLSSSRESMNPSRPAYPERVALNSLNSANPTRYPRGSANLGNVPQYATQGNLVLSPDYPPQISPRRERRSKRLTQPSVTPDVVHPNLAPPVQKTRKKRYKFQKKAPFILGFLALGIFGVTALAAQAWQTLRSPLTALSGEQLELFLDQPPLEIPVADALTLTPSLSREQAQSLVESWLTVKAQALGNKQEVNQLTTILAEPMLSIWSKRAQALGAKNYWQYQHQVEVQSWQVDSKNPRLATIVAKVAEKASYYEQGKLNPQRSFDEILLVRYQLTRSGNKWLIRDSQVL